MSSEDSFIKKILHITFTSFFRVFAVGAAILCLIFVFSILIRKPPTAHHNTTAVVVPNHEWKQEPLSTTAPTIVKINIDGVIGVNNLTQSSVRNQLVDTIDGEINREQIKGILLAINSPGGTVDDSDGIYRLIQEYKARMNVPVYAYVDGMCASGGMYIACAADKVYASDASLIGHVGVILGPIFNFSQLMEHVGIQSKTITSGKNKDALNPFRPWAPGEEENFQHITSDFYKRFVSIVSKSRPKLTSEVLVESGAQIYPANQAEALGYIDGSANTVDVVMKQLSSDLGIENSYQVVELQSKNWLDDLLSGEQVLFKGKVEHTISLPGSMHPSFSGKFLYLYCPEYQK